MRRFERVRRERIRRMTSLLGMSFALGALAGAALTWRLDEFDFGAPETLAALAPEPVLVPEPAPAQEPARAPGPARAAGPGASERPAARGEPAAVVTTGVILHSAAVEILRERDLKMPVDHVDDDDLRDTFVDVREGHAHEAIDIMAPRHTAVRAVEDGTIAKLFNSQGGGGITIYQFDPTGTFCYYYAHLDRYAPGLREGQAVERGDTIGYVGSTGNASPNAPHLHFAIFRLTPERQWWKGQPINPYPVLR